MADEVAGEQAADAQPPAEPPPAVATGGTPAYSRGRKALVGILIALGTIFLALGTYAIWIDKTALDTDTFADVSGDVIADPEVQQVLAQRMVDKLWEEVDVEAALAQKLPPAVQPLAGPAAAGLQQLSIQAAERVLASPRGQEAWRTAVRIAHSQLISFIRNEGSALQTQQGGAVVLDVSDLILELADEVGVRSQAESALARRPLGQFVIVPQSRLDTVQKVTEILDKLAFVLGPLAVLCYVGAVWLSRRRRGTVMAIAFSIIAAAILIGALRRVGGNYIVNDLAQTSEGAQAGKDVWNVLTRQLSDAAWTGIVLGLAALAGVWLTGAHRHATRARTWLAPYLADWRIAYGALAFLVLIVLWWSPVAASRRAFPVIAVTVITAIGLEVLRRQVAEETKDDPPATV